MTVEFKAGTLEDFFTSAKETAREIDAGKKVTRKNTIWISPSDLMAILKPERRRLIQYLRQKQKIAYSELRSEMNRTPVSLNNDLKILEKYQLIKIVRESNPGHGVHKIIESVLGNEKIEFKATI